jgi:hypothetical protein
MSWKEKLQAMEIVKKRMDRDADIMKEIDKLELRMRKDKKMVQVCEPETGKFIEEENELGSTEDLKNYQEGREEIPDCQVGNGLRSLWGLMDCQEDSQGISHCQLGNDMRSLRDLEYYQEGSGSISDC